jgi:hypothetical protein
VCQYLDHDYPLPVYFYSLSFTACSQTSCWSCTRFFLSRRSSVVAQIPNVHINHLMILHLYLSSGSCSVRSPLRFPSYRCGLTYPPPPLSVFRFGCSGTHRRELSLLTYLVRRLLAPTPRVQVRVKVRVRVRASKRTHCINLHGAASFQSFSHTRSSFTLFSRHSNKSRFRAWSSVCRPVCHDGARRLAFLRL